MTSWWLATVLLANDPLIDVEPAVPRVVIELRYATANNFTKRVIYPVETRCQLRQSVVARLKKVQAALAARKLRLKLWDCYRPQAAQERLWQVVHDPRYVADPKKGSKHTAGRAIDLTIVDERGSELDMGTGYDEFSDRAHPDFRELSPGVLRNRVTLSEAMREQGFTAIRTEWWHFDAPP